VESDSLTGAKPAERDAHEVGRTVPATSTHNISKDKNMGWQLNESVHKCKHLCHLSQVRGWTHALSKSTQSAPRCPLKCRVHVGFEVRKACSQNAHTLTELRISGPRKVWFDIIILSCVDGLSEIMKEWSFDVLNTIPDI
jgi:hypothetical protein